MVVAFVAIAWVGSPSWAQEDAGPESGSVGGIGHAGTREIGGYAYLEYDKLSSGGQSASGNQVVLNPAYGFFVSDTFLFRFGLAVSFAGGDLFENSASRYGFQLEPVYVAPSGTIFWYVGGVFGISIVAPDQGDNLRTIGLGGQGGALIPLNEWLALDVGARILFESTNTEPSTSATRIPLGLLGVRGYF